MEPEECPAPVHESVALFPSQRDSSAVPSLSKTRPSSFQRQRADTLDPLSNFTNFKSTVRPTGTPSIQVQTEAGGVSLSVLVSVKSRGKVRLM